MKIALVLESFDPASGGLEHWTWQFARSLVRHGHEVHVLAFDSRAEGVSDGIHVHTIAKPKSRLRRAEAFAAAVPALGCDVVHDMGVGWFADVIHPHGGSTKTLWTHNLLRIPKWRQIRFWRERRYRELAEIESRQHAQGGATIVPVSQMVQRHFESLHGLPAARMRVIHNGVDDERFTPELRGAFRAATRGELRVGDGEVLFLMLAHNLLLKNAETFIRAVAQLVTRGAAVRAVIAGGKKPERFSKLAQQLGVADAVTFLGLVEPMPYYAAADVFVHPTWYDPCSLVTLEAAACGLPVITTRFNGASELMADGVDGFVLHDPADHTALAARMQELLDANKRDAMGAAGRQLALRHTFEQQTTAFLQLYGDLIAAKRR